MSLIPIDILQDFFLFFDRNEIERNQLVCKHWNRAVKLHISTIPLRKLKNLAIRTKNTRFPYATIDGEVVYDVEERERVQKRAENLKYCVIEEMILENGCNLKEKSIQMIFKSLITLSSSKLRILSLQYDCNCREDFTSIFNFIQDYISPSKLHLRVMSRVLYSSDARFYNPDDIETVDYNDYIPTFPSTIQKIYLIHKGGKFDLSFTVVNLLTSLDTKYRIIFGTEYSVYHKMFCKQIIEYYLTFNQPTMLARSIKFKNFENNVLFDDLDQSSFREWLRSLGQKYDFNKVERGEEDKEVYEIKTRNKDRSIRILMSLTERKNAVDNTREICILKIKLFV